MATKARSFRVACPARSMKDGAGPPIRSRPAADEAAKEILDQMAPFIFLSVVAVGAFGSLSRRDDRLGAITREELSHLVGVESFVAEKRAASDAVHELVDQIDVVTLAGNQDEGDEISQGVDECADLCRQSAA